MKFTFVLLATLIAVPSMAQENQIRFDENGEVVRSEEFRRYTKEELHYEVTDQGQWGKLYRHVWDNLCEWTGEAAPCWKNIELIRAGGEEFGEFLLGEYDKAIEGGFLNGEYFLTMALSTGAPEAVARVNGYLRSDKAPHKAHALTAVTKAHHPESVRLAGNALLDEDGTYAIRPLLGCIGDSYKWGFPMPNEEVVRRIGEIEHDSSRSFGQRLLAWRAMNAFAFKGAMARPPEALDIGEAVRQRDAAAAKRATERQDALEQVRERVRQKNEAEGEVARAKRLADQARFEAETKAAFERAREQIREEQQKQ